METSHDEPKRYTIDWGVTENALAAIGICSRTEKVCKIALREMAVLMTETVKDFCTDGKQCDQGRSCLNSGCEMNDSDDESILSMIGLGKDERLSTEVMEAGKCDDIVEMVRALAEMADKEIGLKKRIRPHADDNHS